MLLLLLLGSIGIMRRIDSLLLLLLAAKQAPKEARLCLCRCSWALCYGAARLG